MHGGVGDGVGVGVGQEPSSGSHVGVGDCAVATDADASTAARDSSRTIAGRRRTRRRLIYISTTRWVSVERTPGRLVDPVEDDLGEVAVVRELAVGEDVRLSPARVRLLHAVECADRREDVLRVSRFDRNEDVRSRGHVVLAISGYPDPDFASWRTSLAPPRVPPWTCRGQGAAQRSTREREDHARESVVQRLRDHGEVLAGFTTSDIRRGGRRTGFVITGMGGLERLLAVRGGPGPKVGSYGVDVRAFEEVALLELENGLELGATLVIDEIGKMELLSDRVPRARRTRDGRRPCDRNRARARRSVHGRDQAPSGRPEDRAARTAATTTSSRRSPAGSPKRTARAPRIDSRYDVIASSATCSSSR